MRYQKCESVRREPEGFRFRCLYWQIPGRRSAQGRLRPMSDAHGDGVDLRVGDKERDAAATTLQAHCVAGRLTVAELEARLDRAMAAQTRRELQTLLHDLPSTARTTQHEGSQVLPRMPGIRPFTCSVAVPAPPQRACAAAIDTIAPALAAGSFELVEQSERHLVFERDSSLLGPLLATLMFFPIGAIALINRRQPQRIVFSFRDADGGCQLIVHGSASRSVRRAVAELG